MHIRQPIVAVLGHVDSGKTSLLDRIRGTKVQRREAGGITQHIGASFLPLETIQSTCGQLYKKLENTKNKIPGILVIDTPGHEVFTNLRSRGGSAADIAVLVVDVNRGFQQQTNESLKILASRKVPFVIALNKCDQISGWRPTKSEFISFALKEQDASVQAALEQKLYDVVGTLSVLGYKSEAFYRIKDFKSELAIVPMSARSGVGIPELLGVIVGLTQQYMQKRLDQKTKDSRGIVLEINDEVGLGQTANVILVDGVIKKDDKIIVAKRDSVVVTKPKALLLPKPLDEMRDPRDKFISVSSVTAAAGLKIASPDLEGVLPGSTLYVASNLKDTSRFTNLIESEMKKFFVDTTGVGVIVKCDTIGSLEALIVMLDRLKIPIAKADIGSVNRRDVVSAGTIKEKDRHRGVILAFNVRVLPDAQEESDESHVKIFKDKIIYSLIDRYDDWVNQDMAHVDDAIFAELTPISKFTFIKGFAFRNRNPAVFGIQVKAGMLRQKIPFMDVHGKRIGVIHQLQLNGETVESASKDEQVACSVQNATIGKTLFEDATYYTLPRSGEAKVLLSKYLYRLNQDQQDALKEIVDIQRLRDPAYAY